MSYSALFDTFHFIQLKRKIAHLILISPTRLNSLNKTNSVNVY